MAIAPTFHHFILLTSHTPRDVNWAWFFIVETDTAVKDLQSTPVQAGTGGARPRSETKSHVRELIALLFYPTSTLMH